MVYVFKTLARSCSLDSSTQEHRTYLVVSIAFALVSVDAVSAFFIAIDIFGPVADEEIWVEEKSFWAALIGPSISMRALNKVL